MTASAGVVPPSSPVQSALPAATPPATDIGVTPDPGRARQAAVTAPALPPARPAVGQSTGWRLARTALLATTAISLSLALELLVVSSLQHRAAQQRAFEQLRKELAEGRAPLSPNDSYGRPLPSATPVALLVIPSIHVHEVVGEGTSSAALMSGPGHRRGTPLPGQAGTSVILGRQAAYGGPFKHLSRLRVGQQITVTTGEGMAKYQVIKIRHAGDLAPAPVASGQGRLMLITARGTPFLPSGTLRVDADLMTPVVPPSPAATAATPWSERVMGSDTSSLWALVLWLQVLIVIAIGIVWSWHRWGRQQTWIVFFPVTALVGLIASEQFLKLLPNLL